MCALELAEPGEQVTQTIEPEALEAELARVHKVQLLENSSGRLPLLNLNDREFELFCYELFRAKLDSARWNVADAVRLLNEGTDRGRDLVLYRQQRTLGVVQCKRIASSLGLNIVLKEVIKFLLFSLVHPELMPEANGFMYTLASAGPLTEEAGDLFHESQRVLRSNQDRLPDLTAKVLSEYASFEGLSPAAATRTVLERLPHLRYELLNDAELSRQAAEFPFLIDRFFKVATVVDAKAVEAKLASMTQALEQVPARIGQVLANQQARSSVPGAAGEARAVKNPMYSPSAAFIERPVLMERLSSCMARSGRAALVGLAGTGKTYLGLRYGQLHDAELDIVWWCDASSPDGGMNDLLRLYERLGLHPSVRDPLERGQILRETLTRLKRWLLVFDGAQQSAKAVIRSIVPPSNGAVIITSTMPNQWHDIAQEVTVDAFEPSEAISFIVQRSAGRLADGTAALAHLLDNIPLALELATSFALESGCSAGEYVKLFPKYRFELLQKSDPPVDYGRTIQTAWSMAMSRTRERSLAAAQLIGSCSFLASTGIRLAMLRGSAQEAPQPLRGVLEDELQTRVLLKDAQAYSLVAVENDTLRMHQLVQRFTRQELEREPESGRHLLNMAAHSIDRSLPEVTHVTRSTLREIVPHALAISEHLDKADPVVSAGILNQVGLFLAAEGGDFRKGHQLLLKAAERCVAAGPPAASIELAVRGNLSWIESEIGDLEEAEKGARWVLDRSKEVAKPGQVAIAYNNLSKVLEKQRKMQEARDALTHALRILQPLGPAADEDAAIVSGNLARLYAKEGKLKEAISLQRQVLSLRRRLFPDGHPDVALVMSELARSLIYDRNLDEAQPLCEAALEMAKTLSGPSHLKTGDVMNTLAFLHLKKRDTEKARDLAAHADRIAQAVHGSGWAGRIAPLSILAQAQKLDGDADEALKTCLMALSLVEPDLNRLSNEAHDLVYIALSILPAEVTPDTLESHLRLFSALSVHSPSRPALAKKLVNRICRYLIENDRLDEARDVTGRALQWLVEDGRTESDEYAAVVAAGATVAISLEQLDAAEKGFREAANIWSRLSPGSEDWAEVTIGLGVVLRYQGRFGEAVTQLESVASREGLSDESRLIAQFEAGIALLLDGRLADAERRLLVVLDSGGELVESAAQALRKVYEQSGRLDDLQQMDSRLAQMQSIRKR